MFGTIAFLRAILAPLQPDISDSPLTVVVRENCGREITSFVVGEKEALLEAKKFRTPAALMVCIESDCGAHRYHRWLRKPSDSHTSASKSWCRVDPDSAEDAGAIAATA